MHPSVHRSPRRASPSWLALVLLFPSLACSRQEARDIVPPVVSTAVVRFGVDTFAMSRGDDDVGTAMQTTIRDTLDGRPVVLQVWRQVDDAGDVSDSLWMAEPSLELVRQRRVGPMSRVSLDVTTDSIVGTRTSGDEPTRTIAVAKPEGPFFAAGANDLVARALPLADGYATEVAIFVAERGERRIRFTVLGREDVTRLDDTLVPTWRVAIDWLGDDCRSTVWITRETRELVRIGSGDSCDEFIWER